MSPSMAEYVNRVYDSSLTRDMHVSSICVSALFTIASELAKTYGYLIDFLMQPSSCIAIRARHLI